MIVFLIEKSIEIIAFLQTYLIWLTPVMRLFTFLGNVEFYLLVMPLLVWSIDYHLGVRVGVILMLSGALNTFLKIGLRQPRPYWISSKIQNLSQPMGSFGLPSGHSQNAASVFGLLALSAKKKWLRYLLVFMIVMIAFSRLYLGVHSLLDVLIGLAVGALLLVMFIFLEDKINQFFTRVSAGTKIGLVFLITVGLLVVGILIKSAGKNMQIPALWLELTALAHPEEMIVPFSIEGVVTASGALMGLVAGNLFLGLRGGGYDAARGRIWQHVLRFTVGILGVLVIWRGLGVVFPDGEHFLGIVLRYLRYTLIGSWITGFAPMIFIKLNIAECL